MELERVAVRAALEERKARLARGAAEPFLQVLLEVDPHLAEARRHGVVGAAQANDLGRRLGLAVGRGVEVRDDGARPSRGLGRGLASTRRDLRLAVQGHEVERDVRPQRWPGLDEHLIDILETDASRKGRRPAPLLRREQDFHNRLDRVVSLQDVFQAARDGDVDEARRL